MMLRIDLATVFATVSCVTPANAAPSIMPCAITLTTEVKIGTYFIQSQFIGVLLFFSAEENASQGLRCGAHQQLIVGRGRKKAVAQRGQDKGRVRCKDRQAPTLC